MKRWLYVHQTIALPAADVEARLGELRRLLQQATGSEVTPPEGDGSFVLAVPGPALGKEIGKQVRFHTGPVRRAGNRLVLPVSWRAAPAGALFPVFEGTLEVEGLDSRRSQLLLVGTTTPPLGPLGKALDSTVFHAIAERTAGRLLSSLCGELESQVLGPHAAHEIAETIGKASLDVSDVMTPDPLVVDETTSIRTAAVLLHHGGITGLPVVDADRVLVGVLSEADLLPHIASKRFGLRPRGGRERHRRDALTAGDACTRPARCTAPDAHLSAAAREMIDHDVSRLVVLDHGGAIVGILTRHDVLRAMIRGDASLRQAVEVLLRTEGLDEVDVEAAAGHIRLQGAVELRSTADRLPLLIEKIDGVDAVDASDLRWRVDDVRPVDPIPFT
jgi:CBS domain-containing protein